MDCSACEYAVVVEEEVVVVVVQRAAAIHTAPVRALDRRSIISPSTRSTPTIGHDYDGSARDDPAVIAAAALARTIGVQVRSSFHLLHWLEESRMWCDMLL